MILVLYKYGDKFDGNSANSVTVREFGDSSLISVEG